MNIPDPPNLLDDNEDDLIANEGLDILEDMQTTGGIRDAPQPPLMGGNDQEEQRQQQSEPVVDPNNGWDEQVEKVARTIANKAYKSRELHDLARVRASRRNTFFNMLLIGVTALAGIFPLIPFADKNTWLKLLAGILSQVATSLAVINAFLNFGGESEKHRMAEKNFRRFFAKMQQQLLQPNAQDRMKGNIFMQSILDAMSKVANDAPPLPDAIIKNYRTKVTSSEQLTPEEMEMRDITIGVSLGEVPVLRRVNTNGREGYVIEIDPISDDFLRNTVFGMGEI
jgi:hypothetical protein